MYALLGRVVWFFGKRAARKKVQKASAGQRVVAAVTVAALVAGLAALGRRT